MKVAYFDCFHGAAGDMIVAAILDAGASGEILRDQLRLLDLPGYTAAIEKTTKQGFSAMRFRVQCTEPQATDHRHLHDIRALLAESSLSTSIQRRAIRVFERLAQAEATVHGISVEEVHFHEVGAIDAIVDITAAVLALDLLDVDRVICSPIPVGSGVVECAHGTIPVPAPATTELLKGVPLAASTEPGELTTPTGAALLTTLADSFGPLPEMVLETVGYGAGTREGDTQPNLLRVMVGSTTPVGDTDEIVMLETNLDDASPELVAHCMDRLLQEGARDAYVVPIQMKKSRCGMLLTVLCEPGCVSALEKILFAETTTLGIRRHRVQRSKLPFQQQTVQTAFGEIRMKVGQGHGVVTASAEYEDCRAAAAKHRVPLRDVMEAAQAAWRSWPPNGSEKRRRKSSAPRPKGPSGERA